MDLKLRLQDTHYMLIKVLALSESHLSQGSFPLESHLFVTTDTSRVIRIHPQKDTVPYPWSQ